jgi:hypothetical protein
MAPFALRASASTTATMLQPEFKEISRLAREATLDPDEKSVSADLLTPVSAYLAI